MAKRNGTGTGVILKDFMRTAEPGTLVHIGCADGFICVVTPEEFEEHIKHWDEHYREVYAGKARMAIDVLFSLFEANRGTTCFKDDTICMSYALVKDLENYKDRADQKLKAAKKFLDRAADFVPFEFREVMESTDRLTGGITALLKGPEHGQFWDRAEYERDIPEELKDGDSV